MNRREHRQAAGALDSLLRSYLRAGSYRNLRWWTGIGAPGARWIKINALDIEDLGAITLGSTSIQ